jgi:DNA-binding NarL/FixJ family response regulator
MTEGGEMESPRVLLADDLPEMSEKVTQPLRDDFEIVGSAVDGEDAIKAATTYNLEGSDLDTSSVHVLVVEDSELFRRFLRSTLGKRPELQIMGEVSDGLEAVHKAQELQPDLILLDIGLPTLNGIDAARRIRKVARHSKILFVSHESSADVAQEALDLGALGYVVKAHAGRELLVAVETVRQGRQFVSAGLSGHVPAELGDSHVSKPPHFDDTSTSLREETD